MKLWLLAYPAKQEVLSVSAARMERQLNCKYTCLTPVPVQRKLLQLRPRPSSKALQTALSWSTVARLIHEA